MSKENVQADFKLMLRVVCFVVKNIFNFFFIEFLCLYAIAIDGVVLSHRHNGF